MATMRDYLTWPDLIPEERRFSHIYKGNKELIDHIFVSEDMIPGQPRRMPMVDSEVFINPLPSLLTTRQNGEVSSARIMLPLPLHLNFEAETA
jgi:hypothetical protein